MNNKLYKLQSVTMSKQSITSVSSQTNLEGCLDIDLNRGLVFSTNHDYIKLHKYDNNESNILEYVNTIPLVNTWDKQLIAPDNLLLHRGGDKILLSDANNYDSILALDI